MIPNDKERNSSKRVGSGLVECGKMSNPLTVTLLSEEDFGNIKEEWNCLLQQSHSSSFFLKWQWLYAFWESLPKNQCRLFVVLVYESDVLVAIGPFYVRRSSFCGIPVSKVSFLGDKVASDYMDIFALPQYEEDSVKVVLKYVLHKYVIAELAGICKESNLYRYIQLNSQLPWLRYLKVNVVSAPRVIFPHSLGEIQELLSKNTRYLLKRKMKNLLKDFPSVDFYTVPLLNGEGYLDTLFRLHKKRWDLKKNEKSTFSSNFRLKFNIFLLGLCEVDDGCFSVVEVEEKIISILYIFKFKKHFYFYQNGWDPNYSKYSVGLLNIHKTLEFAVSESSDSFDMLRGDEPYKYKFQNDVREISTLILFNNNFQGAVMFGCKKLSSSMKKRIKGLVRKISR